VEFSDPIEQAADAKNCCYICYSLMQLMSSKKKQPNRKVALYKNEASGWDVLCIVCIPETTKKGLKKGDKL
jgi:hypothetical protein